MMKVKKKCDVCTFTGKTEAGLKTHKTRKHKEEDLPETCSCFYCAQKFEELDELIDHFSETGHNLPESEHN